MNRPSLVAADVSPRTLRSAPTYVGDYDPVGADVSPRKRALFARRIEFNCLMLLRCGTQILLPHDEHGTWRVADDPFRGAMLISSTTSTDDPRCKAIRRRPPCSSLPRRPD
jgi:hypothetical protein